jgi:hypothetical protein
VNAALYLDYTSDSGRRHLEAEQLRLIGVALLIGVAWALAWGVCGLGIGIVGVAKSLDTGHVPHFLVVFIVSVVSGVVGFFSGVAYAFISRTMPLQRKGRMVTGAVVAASGVVVLVTVGAIANTSSTQPFFSTFREGIKGMLVASPVAAVLGASLGALDSKLRT